MGQIYSIVKNGNADLGVIFRFLKSRWGTLIFDLKPSWQYRQLADNMYVNKKQILVPSKLQSNFLFFMSNM